MWASPGHTRTCERLATPNLLAKMFDPRDAATLQASQVTFDLPRSLGLPDVVSESEKEEKAVSACWGRAPPRHTLPERQAPPGDRPAQPALV